MEPSATPPSSLRWWPAALIVLLAGANVAYLQLADLEGGMRAMRTFQTLGLLIFALIMWFAFLSRLPWRTRLKWLAIGGGSAACVGIVLAFVIRPDGSISGAGVLRFVWARTPKPDTLLPDLPGPGPEAVSINLTTLSPNDSPQFLGPDRTGVVRGVRLARSWSAESPRQVWRQPIGAGWSSFAIVGQAAITQEQRGDNEMIVCYEVPTGRALWHHSNRVRFTETQGGDGPRATPTISGGKVYALGATGIFDCLDGATGKLLWTHDTLKEHSAPNLYWGKSSSPLIVDDLVVISGGDSEGPSLLAYHRDTGAPAWHAGQVKSSYASPMLTTLGGRRQIVMVNGTSVTGHDPATGETLWTYSWPGDWPKCSQPVVLDNDHVFLSAGYQVGCVLLKIEMTKPQEERVAEIWKNNNLRAQFTDVVAHDGFLYGIDDAILVCLDPATGKRTWKGERYGHGQILLVDDLILVQSEPGDVVLVEANPNKHRELGRFPALSDKTWNVPALSGPYLLVRNDREAACYKLPVQRVTQR